MTGTILNMKKTTSLRDALRLIILNYHPKPIIALHELNMYIYMLYRDRMFDGIRIGKIQATEPDKRIMDDALEDMVNQGILSPIIPSFIWQISNKNQASAQQIACCLTPYSHLAYLSAMEWHGITDRIPHVVHLIQAPLNTARSLYQEHLLKDFPAISNMQPLMIRGFTPYEKIDGKELIFHTHRNYRKKQELHDSGGIRVSNIGETFLDMLREPDLCGGFSHVQDVFREYAGEYLPVIVKTVDKNGKGIDKARVGYLLEEVCGLTHRTIEIWKKTVQRGGSRKLIASNPYKKTYSEVWCISINN
ncbi:conserved hypothetical protein [Xenorhabdus cabanillasii JM26]|uniref:Uncharacterized protein n=2 Tax=Xenorhabdus cabanillasii TaxID=351673 RepID=W1IS80_9GAMM|nr:hypothetical protein Xcab_02310 [Xenorhabdus cabanillasii JM26]CDL80080.1 conserved hypothetical protein [Xenorhabdus cabanillasii JM26]